jgi:hypothetical protein
VCPKSASRFRAKPAGGEESPLTGRTDFKKFQLVGDGFQAVSDGDLFSFLSEKHASISTIFGYWAQPDDGDGRPCSR